MWIADARRDDGKRFIVRADEKLTAFVELELAVQTRKQAMRSLDFFRATENRIGDNVQ